MEPEGSVLCSQKLSTGSYPDIIHMDLSELGWDGVDWIDMAQDKD
jgi:hypothetical protein